MISDIFLDSAIFEVFGKRSFYIKNSRILISKYVFEIFWWSLKFLVSSKISAWLDASSRDTNLGWVRKKSAMLATTGLVRCEKGKNGYMIRCDKGKNIYKLRCDRRWSKQG